MGEKILSSLDELIEQLIFIKQNNDKEFEGEVLYVEPNGQYYHVKIVNDAVLNGTDVFSSYGDIKDYENVLTAALQGRLNKPADGKTTGPKFAKGDHVKFKLALDLRAIHLEMK